MTRHDMLLLLTTISTKDYFSMFPERLDHLPEKKRSELAQVLKIVFEEFGQAQNGKQRIGLILKVILFGSYARGDWVEDGKSGYRSDYDLLIVVNIDTWSEQHDIWYKVSEIFLRELTITGRIKTPVNFIVHSLQDLNDKLSTGKTFFVDIAKEGVPLYELDGYPFAKSRKLDADESRMEAQGYYDRWYPFSLDAVEFAEFGFLRRKLRDSAFMLHQATERAYHCVLLVLTLYSPKSHRLKVLRATAERLEPRLIQVWPRDTKFSRRSFERLDRAYVDARYSPQFSVTDDEMIFIFEHVKLLHQLVREVCLERLER